MGIWPLSLFFGQGSARLPFQRGASPLWRYTILVLVRWMHSGIDSGFGDGQEHVDVTGSLLGVSISHHAMVSVIHASLFWTSRSYRF